MGDLSNHGRELAVAVLRDALSCYQWRPLVNAVHFLFAKSNLIFATGCTIAHASKHGIMLRQLVCLSVRPSVRQSHSRSVSA